MNLKKKPGGQRQPQRKDKGTEKERKNQLKLNPQTPMCPLVNRCHNRSFFSTHSVAGQEKSSEKNMK